MCHFTCVGQLTVASDRKHGIVKSWNGGCEAVVASLTQTRDTDDMSHVLFLCDQDDSIRLLIFHGREWASSLSSNMSPAFNFLSLVISTRSAADPQT